MGITETVSRQAVKLPKYIDCESRGSDHDQKEEEHGADDAGFPFPSNLHFRLAVKD